MKREAKATDFLSVSEVAVRLCISPNSVRRKFAGLSGVLNVGTSEQLHKRPRRILRILTTTLEKYIAEHQTNRRK
jgi:hypothetical protein